MTREVPTRINPDAILEAIVEIRFGDVGLPEIFLGRLLSSPVFRHLTPTRLPHGDIPAFARESDASLRFLPIYQMEGEGELVRIGANALSIHILPPYWGWERFSRRIEEIVRSGWAEAGRPPLERCGLRYVNALTSTKHRVHNIGDLNLQVSVAGENLVDLTVSYISQNQTDTEALVRVASIKHVQGEVPEDATFVVDIDVRTTGDVSAWREREVLKWLEEAHKIEKTHFFGLLPETIVAQLEEG